MNFKELVAMTMNRCNVDDDDDQAIAVIKLGLNDGYKEIAKHDKLIITSKVPIIMGKVHLPENISELISTDPVLNNSDKIEGRTIITSLDKKIIEVTYSYIPDEMIKDNDIPEIAPKFHSTLINFGCYSYYLFKKKIELANSYLVSFNRTVDSITTEASMPLQIEEVYRI